MRVYRVVRSKEISFYVGIVGREKQTKIKEPKEEENNSKK